MIRHGVVYLSDQVLKKTNISKNKYHGDEPSVERRMPLVLEKFVAAKRLLQTRSLSCQRSSMKRQMF